MELLSSWVPAGRSGHPQVRGVGVISHMTPTHLPTSAASKGREGGTPTAPRPRRRGATRSRQPGGCA